MQSLGLLWLVFDAGLSLTPLMGHLGYLSSHWSVPALQLQLTNMNNFLLLRISAPANDNPFNKIVMAKLDTLE